MKKFIFLLSILAYSISYSQDTIPVTKEGAKIETIVDEMAQFPGGIDELVNYLTNEINYPAEAVKKKLSGRVVLKFVVGKTGEVTSVKVVRGMPECPQCEQEAIRVVESMPNWSPAKKNGDFVPSYYILPIDFSLE